MTFKVYDSATRSVRPFEPIVPGKVGIYICGLTTQASPHIGHIRFAVAFDVLRRWLTRGHGYEVTLVRNVTDIDDKMLAKSAEQGREWWAHSYLHERETAAALDLLGVLPPTYEPRATGHVTDMVELMELLIGAGHAYPAPDGSGDVYFDVRSWPSYGELTRQRLDDMEPAGDADPRGKRDPRDFALWKGRKDDEPATASWPTPWGRGRPGWHLECSAMARRWLGDAFDIHGGGIDLRFPHHENEQAQSRAAGLGFARYWMHNAWVTIGGEKMSKSLGNSLVVSEMARQHRPLEIRYLLTAAHYRSTIEYADDSMADVAAAVGRLEGFLDRVVRETGTTREELLAQALAAGAVFPGEFRAAMDDDLNVSGALAVVFDHVRRGNTALDAAAGGQADAPRQARALAVAVVAMTDVLGANPLDPVWQGADRPGGGAGAGLEAALDALVQGRLEARAQARAEKDWAAADAIRDELAAAGIAVEDSPAGARWTLARPTD